MPKQFLPIILEEVKSRGWDELDVIIVTGDAYVDHPSYGTAIIGRILEAGGFKVGIIPQPDCATLKDFRALGKPKLFFGVTAGNLDSMLANYTSNRNRRREDEYSPGGKAGLRPDRATIVRALPPEVTNAPRIRGVWMAFASRPSYGGRKEFLKGFSI